MNALFLFFSSYSLVLFLGLQSLNVNGGHRLLAMLTSFGISAANVTVLKIMPGPTDWLDMVAYLCGGPLGIVTSMTIHPWMVRHLGRKLGEQRAEQGIVQAAPGANEGKADVAP